MSEGFASHNDAVNAIMQNAGRTTLPFQRANANDHHGTAFWYNHLIESTAEHETVRKYLVTAEALTRFDLAQWTLRAELCEPAMSAERLVMSDFAAGWTRLDGLAVAVMPTAGLEAHAARKGWRWTTDEITDGLAAGEAELAALGEDPVPAYVLAHDVGEERHERLQAVLVGTVTREPAGTVRWTDPLPEGCAGGPVFVANSLGEGRFQLVCLGLVLPGEGPHEIATFDRIRTAVDALGPAVPRRRWWQRRAR